MRLLGTACPSVIAQGTGRDLTTLGRTGAQIKSSLISTGLFTDSLPTHVVAGLGAGFLAVCVGSPVDVVKSRMMGAPALPWRPRLQMQTQRKLEETAVLVLVCGLGAAQRCCAVLGACPWRSKRRSHRLTSMLSQSLAS